MATDAQRDDAQRDDEGLLSGRELLLAAAAGLLARFLWALVVDYSTHGGDSIGYHRMALNVAEYGTFSRSEEPPIEPTVSRAPLLPLVAGLVYRIFGPHQGPVHAMHALLGVGVALVVACTVARLAPRAGRLSLWLLVLLPFDIFPAGRLVSEPLTTFFLCIGASLPLLTRKPGGWALAGASLGLAALGRDVYMPVVGAFAAFFLLLRRFRPPVPWTSVVILCVSTALAIAPWTIRNCTNTPVCTPISKGVMGFNLWMGTWERNGDWMRVSSLDPPLFAYDSEEQKAYLTAPEPSPLMVDAKYRAAAVARITGQPFKTLGIWLQRWPRMWIGTRSDQISFSPSWLQRGAPLWYLLKSSLFLLNTLVLVAGAAGIYLAYRRGSRLLWLAVPIAYNGLIYLPFHNTEPRYTQPVYPLLIGFASVALVEGFQRARARLGARPLAQA